MRMRRSLAALLALGLSVAAPTSALAWSKCPPNAAGQPGVQLGPWQWERGELLAAHHPGHRLGRDPPDRRL